MYTNWAHYYLPKILAVLSFILNPIFVYLLFSEKKTSLGSYRYLLLFFAVFNMSFSLCDTFVPMGVHIHRYAFAVFISDGPFFEESSLSHLMLSIRAGFIACSYAIQNTHFIYRYLVLFRAPFVDRYFLPFGMILSICYCLIHMIIWSAVSEMMTDGDQEVRGYIRESFEHSYGISVYDATMSVGLYLEGSRMAMVKTWIGVTVDSVISFYSVALYFILGHKIMRKLNSQCDSSTSTRTLHMQKQLFRALVVQTIIPICVSYIPCLISWTTPLLGISFGRSVYLSAAIAVSTFPVLDPIAMIICVPSLRNRFSLGRPSVTSSSSCPPSAYNPTT